MNGWTYYQTKDLAVVPYMEGTPVYRDGVLSHLYYRTKEEGHLGRVFHEDGFNHDKFIAFFERRHTLQVLCHIREEGTVVPVGYSWVDNPSGIDGERAVLCAFCFFKDAKRTCRDLGRLGLAYWFTDLRIDILHGVILEWNTPAVNYAKHLGFKEVAYVPKWRYVDGKLTGVRVVQLEAQDYLPGFEAWFETQNRVAKPE